MDGAACASSSQCGDGDVCEHAYHVNNICDDRDNACPAPNTYGSIPAVETKH